MRLEARIGAGAENRRSPNIIWILRSSSRVLKVGLISRISVRTNGGHCWVTSAHLLDAVDVRVGVATWIQEHFEESPAEMRRYKNVRSDLSLH